MFETLPDSLRPFLIDDTFSKLLDCLGPLEWASLVAQTVRICLLCGRPWFNSWVRKIPWRREGQSTLVFLPGKSHGQRRLAGYSPWGRKESDTTERQIPHHHHSITRYKKTKKSNRHFWRARSKSWVLCMPTTHHTVKAAGEPPKLLLRPDPWTHPYSPSKGNRLPPPSQETSKGRVVSSLSLLQQQGPQQSFAWISCLASARCLLVAKGWERWLGT